MGFVLFCLLGSKYKMWNWLAFLVTNELNQSYNNETFSDSSLRDFFSPFDSMISNEESIRPANLSIVRTAYGFDIPKRRIPMIGWTPTSPWSLNIII